jgi:hypothetical protein
MKGGGNFLKDGVKAGFGKGKGFVRHEYLLETVHMGCQRP